MFDRINNRFEERTKTKLQVSGSKYHILMQSFIKLEIQKINNSTHIFSLHLIHIYELVIMHEEKLREDK